jgi:hypothetical protein
MGTDGSLDDGAPFTIQVNKANVFLDVRLVIMCKEYNHCLQMDRIFQVRPIEFRAKKMLPIESGCGEGKVFMQGTCTYIHAILVSYLFKGCGH